ncbi:MAG: glycosyltransferase [Planctomycetes bacterium]|nr:glycosyltransferase [Planctomycetota bacterium]
MRIALVIDSLFGGGSEGVVRRLAFGLGERGHEVVVHCLKNAGASLRGGARVRVVEHRSARRDWRLPFRIGARFRRDHTEVVHAHSCAALVTAFPACRLLRLPIVHVRHGWPLGGPTFYGRWADRLAPWVTRVVINSESGRPNLPPSVREAAIHIPNGLDMPPSDPLAARAELERRCGRTFSGPVVLSIANIRPEKDLLLLLRAFATVQRRRPQATLVIIGATRDPQYAEEVEKERWRLGLDRCTVLTGEIPDASGLIAGADVFCLSSRSEAMPNVVLEAMAQRVPIVASAVGDVGRIDGSLPCAMLMNGESGLLFHSGDESELAEKLELAITDRESSRRRAAVAHQRYLTEFTALRMVERYESLYRDCVASRGRRKRSSRPTVLMVGPGAPQVGGMVTAIENLLASPLRNAYAMSRFCTPPPSGNLIGRVAAPLRHLASAALLMATILLRRIEIAHVHTCSYTTFFRSALDVALSRALGCRVVLHIRGGRFAEFCGRACPRVRNVIRKVAEAADAVVVLSETTRQALAPFLEAANLVVVPNGTAVQPEPARLRPMGVQKSETRPCRFLFLGELRPAKGIFDFLEALAQLALEGAPFEAWCVGPVKPDDRRRIGELLERSGLTRRVRLLPPVSAAERSKLLDSVDCLVHPSHSEGMPNTILEAAASGLAVVATAVGAVPEMVKCAEPPELGCVSWSGAAPLVCVSDVEALVEALAIMCRDAQRRHAVGRDLHELALEEFNLEQLAQRLARVYESTLAPNGGERSEAESSAGTGIRKIEAAVVRRLIYPLHERYCGRATMAEITALRRLARESPQTVALDVSRRLNDLVDFAKRELPFYAERLSAARLPAAASAGSALLRNIPPLTKAEIRAAGENMIWRRASGGCLPHSSGGTTGDTLHFFIDRLRQAQTLAARLLMQERLGVPLGQRRAYLWGSPIERRGGSWRRWRDRFLNETLLDAFDLSPEALDRHLARIAAFKPHLLYAYPSAAAALARRATGTGRRASLRSLRAVVLTGEEVSEAERDAIRAAHDCVVAQEYGSREVGLIAHECAAGGLHVIAPHVLVEAVVGGEPAGFSRTGELLCTTLNTRAQPFIRYRVGDVGALLSEPCSCGLPFPLMRLDGGKITGFLALPGGKLCHGAITSHVLRDQPGIIQFKTIQRGLERFEVLLVTDAQFQRTSLDTIRTRYRELFGAGIEVECSVVSEIPPDPSGKRRYFVCEALDSNAALEFAESR